ncbi:NADPH-dependent F420 reductase [Bauldia sp.]|uniref:NADPH-dependent F420 reductase n=1 Tax=Bauldia sp. TaxID=2575872 RepID=UPI003BAB4BC4
MTIAIIGSGRMGQGLAKRLAAAGETVTLTGRDPDKVAALAADIPGTIGAGPIADAGSADVVFLAVPYAQATEAVAQAGSLTGKVLVDITNPIGPDFTLAVGMTTSGAEEIQKSAPQARVVKAFNTIFSDVLAVQLSEPDVPPQVLYAGDHEFANQKVDALISAIGFAPLFAGPLRNARLLEPIGLMTIQLGMALGHGRRIVPRFVEY